MDPFSSQVASGLFTEEFADTAARFWLRKSRILILVDGRIAVITDPAPTTGADIILSSSAFGIAVAIGEIKKFSAWFSSFEVTVATRDGDGSPKPGFDITGFRFSAEALTRFDQVWMFGYLPGNVRPNSTDPADDSIIEAPEWNPLSDQELAALAQWMDNGGGVFATGDHHLLGASMCHKVPRAATMRAWTITDGVTTRDFTTRFETTRPFTPEQWLGTASIGDPNEEDRLPQQVEWVSYPGPFRPFRGPHPLLCHPEFGPIYHLPDHMHEGRCFDFGDPGWQSTKRDATFSFAGYSNQHFPTVDGARPLPEVIAWGTTLADPPLRYWSGDQPYRRFPLIAAYDGQAIGIGRVVVDSTWHHWFDMNLKGIMDAAHQTGERTILDKIFRYYVNVGIYLASPWWRAGMTLGWLKSHQFEYFGREAIDLTAEARQIGHATLPYLYRAIGRCWLADFVAESLDDNVVWRSVRELLGGSDCGECSLSFEMIEKAVIGEVVRGAYSDMDELSRQIAATGAISSTPLFEQLDAVATEAARKGLRVAIDVHAADLQRASKEIEALPDKTAT